MSCIAGVGGGVRSLVNTAKSGRQIVALDGCPLHCVMHCLALHRIMPDLHVELTRFGVKKRNHVAFDHSEADTVKQTVKGKIHDLVDHAANQGDGLVLEVNEPVENRM